MQKVCKSCRYHAPLKVDSEGEIDIPHLHKTLIRHERHDTLKPLVCIEAANSEIGTINDVLTIGYIVHRHNGILVVDATGYIPSYQINMKLWKNYIDVLTFSGHKFHSLKGIGVLWKNRNIELKPLVYGSQEQGLIGGTENILGIASLGKAIEEYDYFSISSSNRDYVYNYIINNISNCYLVGSPIESGNRLPRNLYVCFKGIDGEALMILLDMEGIQVSTGSACNSEDLSPSTALSAIGMNKQDIHSCICLTFSGNETKEDLDYVCIKITKCVEQLRNFTK